MQPAQSSTSWACSQPIRQIWIDRDAKQKPGAGIRPGAAPEFQFPQCTDLHSRVKRQPPKAHTHQNSTARMTFANVFSNRVLHAHLGGLGELGAGARAHGKQRAERHGRGETSAAKAWDATEGLWRVYTPNSSLSVRPVVALAWAMARSSALSFGREKPCAVPL